MLSFIRKKHQTILGIDITSSAIKILEISRRGDKLCLENYGREPLPPNAVDGYVIKDQVAVSNCIRKVCEKHHFSSTNVAVAIPDSMVVTKMVQLDEGLNDEEMEEMVGIEADKFIPYPLDEINLDFEVQGQSAKNTAMLDVLIVASRSENVSDRIEVINRAGLNVRIIDVESYAVERAIQLIANDLPPGRKDKIVAIIDIGVNYTHLFVLQGMHLVFSREERFGATQIIQAIAEHYKMTLEEARYAKEQKIVPEDYKSKVIEPFKENVLLQIKRTLQFFYTSGQYGSVELILLAGGVAMMPGLSSSIQEQLGITTIIPNPFSTMCINSRINQKALKNDAPSLLVACGLALRHIE